MNAQEKGGAAVIRAALKAATVADAIEVNEMIRAEVGAEYQRPIGDRFNNFGMITASGGSYEYKALEPVTNQQDAVLERAAAERFGASLSDIPYGTPEEAARELLGRDDYRQQADQVAVSFRESDKPTRSSKRLTIIYRDRGCGMTADQVPKTIFALGSGHKTESRWQQGAFGLGGASTYRNAKAIVLVTRRAPEMRPEEDRISVAVVLWESRGKGMSALYLTETDWGADPEAKPWSLPAAAYPDFEPGTHLALVSYGVEGFHRARSGDERSFDMVLNTRLYRPIMPVRFTNEITRGRNEYLRGLDRRLAENPSPERRSDEEEMLYAFEGKSYRLPVRYVVFPAGSSGIRRRFVAKDHAVIFTSNGQVHHHWTPAQLMQRTKLNKLKERVFVEVETDALPIELRTTLFTPDRAEMLANEAALQLEDQVADFLANWDQLVQLNNELVREAISGASSGGSALEVARRIAAALRLKGFNLGAQNGSSGGPGSSGGRRKRRKVPTYPEPTALEGPDRLIMEDGKVRLLSYMLNAEDDFFDSGRGRFSFACDHPDIDVDKHLVVGRLRDGWVRVQLQVPEGAREGKYELTVRLADWHRAAGGIGASMEYRTRLEVVDELNPPNAGSGNKKGGKGPGAGANVAVLWQDPEEHGDGWHNGVPGGVEMVPAADLAVKEEYEALAALGDRKIPTIIFNKDYAPLKSYLAARARDLTTDKGVEDTKDRYAIGLGLGLLLLHEDFEKRAEKEKEAIDPAVELTAKTAVARSVLLMMPAFDTLVKEAGLAEV